VATRIALGARHGTNASGRFADTNASIATSSASGGMATSSGWFVDVGAKRAVTGGNPTGRGPCGVRGS